MCVYAHVRTCVFPPRHRKQCEQVTRLTCLLEQAKKKEKENEKKKRKKKKKTKVISYILRAQFT